MKSYVWLQTADGTIQQVEEEVAVFCPVICREIFQKSMGSSKTNAIMLPERVNPSNLGLILDYCRFHQVAGHSIKVCICGIMFGFGSIADFILLTVESLLLKYRNEAPI